jgi:hypothetical protein
MRALKYLRHSIILGFLACPLRAQDVASSASGASADVDAKNWSFSAAAAGYLIPHSRSYVSPTFMADRGWLHLEARYNYENLETGSLWTGYNFTLNKKIELNFTPMIGGVFGKKTAIAPGYLGTFNYKGIALFSQGELVVDTREHTGSFFYTWSELSYAPVRWFRAGIAAQRTKAYQTGLSVQRGFLAGLTYKRIDFTTYVFNLGWTDPTVVISLGARF